MAAWQMAVASLFLPLLIAGGVSRAVCRAAVASRTLDLIVCFLRSVSGPGCAASACRAACVVAFPLLALGLLLYFLFRRFVPVASSSFPHLLVVSLCRSASPFLLYGLPASTCAPSPASSCLLPSALRSSCLRATRAFFPLIASPSCPSYLPLSASSSSTFCFWCLSISPCSLSALSPSFSVAVSPICLYQGAMLRLSSTSYIACAMRISCFSSSPIPASLLLVWPWPLLLPCALSSSTFWPRLSCLVIGLARLVGGRRLHSPVGRDHGGSAGTGAVAIAADRGVDAISSRASRSSDGAEIAAAGSSDRSEHPRLLRRLLSALLLLDFHRHSAGRPAVRSAHRPGAATGLS